MSEFTGSNYDYASTDQAKTKAALEEIEKKLQEEYALDKGVGGYFDYFSDAISGNLPDWYYEETERAQAIARGEYMFATPDSVTSQQAKAGWHVGMQDDVLTDEIPAGVRGNVYVTQNIYSQAQTAADLMEEAQYEQQRALLQP
jgi:hypothetical protein